MKLGFGWVMITLVGFAAAAPAAAQGTGVGETPPPATAPVQVPGSAPAATPAPAMSPQDSARLAGEIKPLMDAVLADSLNPRKHFELGNAYYDRGRLQDAREQFQRSVDLDSTFWKAWVNLGTVLDELNFDKAS